MNNLEILLQCQVPYKLKDNFNQI